jgi:RNA polymerase sigma factor (sigma-70 family)
MSELQKLELHLDELEALRLCDFEGLTQEEAGERMGVSRGTVQRIITSARKKTAQALSEGQALVFVDSES